MVVANFLLPPVTPLAPGVVAFSGRHLHSEPCRRVYAKVYLVNEYPLLCYFVLYSDDADEV